VSRKKVLFILNNLGGRGAEIVVVNLLNHLNRKQFQWGLFLLKKERVYFDQLTSSVQND